MTNDDYHGLHPHSAASRLENARAQETATLEQQFPPLDAVRRRIESVIAPPFRRGVVEGLARHDYHAACGLNPSSLKRPSPKHVRWTYENNGEETDAMRLGTAVHTLCWEPHRFADDVAVWSGGRRYGRAWDEFCEEHDSRTIITTSDMEKAALIASAFASDPQVARLASSGIAETAVFTVEQDMQCRGLLDWINTDLGLLCDLKVVNSIEPRLFGTAVVRYGWDVSMACYRRWFERESGKRLNGVKLIAVESKPPYDVAVYAVPEAVLENAWAKAQASISQVRRCIETGEWPGLSAGRELDLHVPTWAMDDDEGVVYG